MIDEDDETRFPRLTLGQFVGAIFTGIARVVGYAVTGTGPDPIAPVVKHYKPATPDDNAQNGTTKLLYTGSGASGIDASRSAP